MLAVCTEAADGKLTNAPAVKLFVLPTAREMLVAAENRRTNLTTSISTTTNSVAELTLSSATMKEGAEEVEKMRLEYINSRPMVGAARAAAAGGWNTVLDKLPLPKEGIFSKNPNARRNPLEVDGW